MNSCVSAVLAVAVLLLSCSLVVYGGDIVHQDDVAPRRPGCDNNFVLVKISSHHPLLFQFLGKSLLLLLLLLF